MTAVLKQRSEPYLIVDIWRETLGKKDDIMTSRPKGVRNCATS